MTKIDLVEISKKIHGDKYDYLYLPEKFKTTDYVRFSYLGLIFKQKVSDHLTGALPEKIRIRNTQDFINKSKLLWGHNKYDYSLTEFKGFRQKVKIIYKNKLYEQTVKNHLDGFKCENCWDREKFIIESKKIFKDRYDYSLVEYVNFKTPVKIIFNGEVFEQKPQHHLRGNHPENCNMNKKLNKEKFIEKSIKIFGKKYDYSLVEYINSKTPVKIIFNGNVYEQKPQYHLAGLYPEGFNVVDTESFISKSKNLFKDRYDYSLVDYKNHFEYVKIIYNGQVYLQRPYYHLRGDKPEKRNFKKTTDDFISICSVIHDFKFNYDKTKYLSASSKVTITCPIHGDFEQVANSHLMGHGCQNCSESIGEKEISKFLNKYKITFDRQHKFLDCKNTHQLPFDFYIPSTRMCIEFDGKQHYEPVEHFGGIKAYEQLKINDKIKTDYCEENYINLIRIKYTQLDDIHKILYDNLKNHIKSK